MKILLRLAVNGFAVWLAVWMVDGLQFDGDWIALAVIAGVLAVVNAIVKPILKLLSLPFILVTLGLFLLIINTAVLALVIRISEGMDLGLASTGLGATFLGAIVIAIGTWIGEALTPID